ncbi:glycosyltransferase family 4 protein [Halomicrobium katesii]|uniref:glycosyltransferase family 4 protein n=1 Tax=Halomicrobium katesii TaxID=437163 RepID=UPI000366F857|nr:glycosyltransferase family 4 protein [Halomicrobium katesii]
MNVAITVKEFPPDIIGGTETQTRRMARALSGAGHDVTVYTKAYGRETELDEPYEIVRVPNCRRSSFLSTLTYLLALTALLVRDRNEIDVLQCMMIYPNGFVGTVVHYLTGVPYFAWIRGGDYYFMKANPVKRWLIRTVLWDTTVLVQSEAVRADVTAEFDPTDVRVLGNGVDVPAETASGDEIVFVGRLEEQKGVAVLLRALAGTGAASAVTVVGDGSRRSELEALADELGVDATFVGEVAPEAVGEYLERGRLFVLPSVRGEGLPNAVLEAMAAGLPVVATDTGGVADAIVDGETGYVVEPGDEQRLRDRIETIYADEQRAREMGERAREYVIETYSWDAIVGRLDALYAECTDR